MEAAAKHIELAHNNNVNEKELIKKLKQEIIAQKECAIVKGVSNKP